MIFAKNQTQLARACGFTRQAVAYWLDHSRWPFGNAPWKVAAVKRWHRRMISHRGDREMSEARAALLTTRYESLRLQREQLQQQYLSADECRRRHRMQIEYVRSILLPFPSWIAPLLEGLSEGEIESRFDEAVRIVLTSISDSESPKQCHERILTRWAFESKGRAA